MPEDRKRYASSSPQEPKQRPLSDYTGSDTQMSTDSEDRIADERNESQDSVTLMDIKRMLETVMKEQGMMRQSIKKLDIQATSIASKIDELKEEMYLEIGKIDNKVKKIEERLTALEERSDRKEEVYHVESTIIAINMRENEEDTMKLCAD